MKLVSPQSVSGACPGFLKGGSGACPGFLKGGSNILVPPLDTPICVKHVPLKQ